MLYRNSPKFNTQTGSSTRHPKVHAARHAGSSTRPPKGHTARPAGSRARPPREHAARLSTRPPKKPAAQGACLYKPSKEYRILARADRCTVTTWQATGLGGRLRHALPPGRCITSQRPASAVTAHYAPQRLRPATNETTRGSPECRCWQSAGSASLESFCNATTRRGRCLGNWHPDNASCGNIPLRTLASPMLRGRGGPVLHSPGSTGRV